MEETGGTRRLGKIENARKGRGGKKEEAGKGRGGSRRMEEV